MLYSPQPHCRCCVGLELESMNGLPVQRRRKFRRLCCVLFSRGGRTCRRRAVADHRMLTLAVVLVGRDRERSVRCGRIAYVFTIELCSLVSTKGSGKSNKMPILGGGLSLETNSKMSRNLENRLDPSTLDINIEQNDYPCFKCYDQNPISRRIVRNSFESRIRCHY
mmetsp:Transcript_21812/g.60596  ORF Transcript_21812/g.60596 Transcript_21812/m.60596 type:complete len:166 (-) Transcript_21812:53-550(-)